jgi:hypothetical protein
VQAPGLYLAAPFFDGSTPLGCVAQAAHPDRRQHKYDNPAAIWAFNTRRGQHRSQLNRESGAGSREPPAPTSFQGSFIDQPTRAETARREPPTDRGDASARHQARGTARHMRVNSCATRTSGSAGCLLVADDCFRAHGPLGPGGRLGDVEVVRRRRPRTIATPRTRSSARLPGARLPRRQLNRGRPRGTPRRPLNGGVGSAWTGASNIDRERDADQPRLGAQGSSSTVQRGGGHWSRAHSKKFWPSSSSTVRCCRPTTIQGLSGLCSVSVKPSFDTNICSHDCQGVGALARTARSRLPAPLARSVPSAVLGRRVPLRRRYAAVGIGPPTIGHGPPQLVRSWCPAAAPRETSSAFIARPAAVSAPSW